MKKLNEELNPELQGVNFITGKPGQLEKGGSGPTDQTRQRLLEQQQKIKQARRQNKQSLVQARKSLQQQNKTNRAAVQQNLGLLQNLIGVDDTPDTEFIDDQENELTNGFGLTSTRQTRFGLGQSSFGRKKLG